MGRMYERAKRGSRLQCWRCMHRCKQLIVVFACWFATAVVQADGKAERSLYSAPSRCEVQRAGMSHGHFPWARKQVECDYVGYYVGGGAPWGCSRGRTNQEGTWGWDYAGRHFKRKVFLCWSYLQRKQGGVGSYQPDGPRVAETIKHSLEN